MARIYRATFKAVAGDGTLMEPSLHYQTDVPTGGDEPDPVDVAGAIQDHLQASFRAVLMSTANLTEFSVREMVIPPDIGAAATIAGDGVGNLLAAGDVVPLGLVPIINLHTNVASRNARGHIAGPSPGSAFINSSRKWNTTYMALLNAFAAQLDDSMSLGSVFPTTLNPVVYSRTRHLRDDAPFAFRVTSATVNTTPHWLRSRQSSP